MKILIVNEFYKCGGAEVYAHNLKKLFKENGHQARLLCFTFDEKDKLNASDDIDFLKISGEYNKLIFNPFIYKRLTNYLKNFNPEIIIINNIFSAPYTQLMAFGKYKCIQVVHDYSIVCPKATCVYENYDVCGGYLSDSCLKKCLYRNSKLKLLIKEVQLYLENIIRKRTVDYFISPSEKLAQYMEKYKFNVCCINNPIEKVSENYDVRQKLKIKKYVYVGEISEKKGAVNLLKHFLRFSENKEVTLDFIGRVADESKEIFYENIEKSDKINYLGLLPHDEVINRLKEYYCIVVPSIWMENYPTTVLEAMLSKTLVLGSDRGGIPEMLEDNRGFTSSLQSELEDKLNETYYIESTKYLEMINKSYEYVFRNNSYNIFYEKIMEKIDLVKK